MLIDKIDAMKNYETLEEYVAALEMPEGMRLFSGQLPTQNLESEDAIRYLDINQTVCPYCYFGIEFSAKNIEFHEKEDRTHPFGSARKNDEQVIPYRCYVECPVCGHEIPLTRFDYRFMSDKNMRRLFLNSTWGEKDT